MFPRFLPSSCPAIFAVCLGATALPALAANDILPGYDLFQSLPGTELNGQPFIGDPLGTFNFGGTIGVQGVGNADTIIQRLGSAVSPTLPSTSPVTVQVQMQALQLMTPTPVDLGAGTGFYFVTLQSARPAGGTPTTGNLSISFDSTGSGGTFDSFFDVFFDIRFGSLSGPIVQSTDITLTGTGNTWTRTPPTGSLELPGVNYQLNKTDTSEDFWPVPPVTESHPGVGVHIVTEASPEPASLALFGIGALALLGARKRL
ncbi:MAG TPA: PEP-CTERM sorting domain-containing protein [Phycisphaerae bacterium]|nr:PEP-CTERM sorting domain-containing protein [Phycisphaerae bacterium]